MLIDDVGAHSCYLKHVFGNMGLYGLSCSCAEVKKERYNVCKKYIETQVSNHIASWIDMIKKNKNIAHDTIIRPCQFREKRTSGYNNPVDVHVTCCLILTVFHISVSKKVNK